MMKFLLRKIIISQFVLLLFIFAVGVNAQNAGKLDTSFGSGGTVTANFVNSIGFYDLSVQPDKKIVLVGASFDPINVQIVGMIARFNENGTLDTTFDLDGYNNSFVLKTAFAVHILADGKILVGGYDITNRFCIARLNNNGSLDTTFDGDGIVSTTVGFASRIISMNVLPNGKIVAVGWTQLNSSNNNRDFAIVKYNADGSLDTTFGSNGRVATDLGSNDISNDSAIQADGKIIAVGYTVDQLSTNKVAAIIRYNTDGSVDTTFGNNGKVLRTAGQNAEAGGVDVQADGKIIVVGSGFPPARYNSNGTFDIDFNLPTGCYCSAITIQSNGKILIGGFDFPTTNRFLARFNIDGSLDSSFGNGGITSSTLAPSTIAIAPDNKIVIAGDASISRYFNDSPRMDFDGDSKTEISIFRPGPGEWWYSRSSDGGNRAFQFGSGSDKIVPADYTGDGRTDVAFFRPSTGQWFVLRSEDSSFFAFPFGNSTDVPAPADYDGDGKADAAVFRESNLTWYINKSSGGTDIIGFGAAADKPVIADYDGDGKSDIAIFRPNGASGAEWWIRRSSNASVFALQFGNSTDKAVPGDFTGDGKVDVAIWRPSNGNWFVLRSEDFSFYAFPFGTSTDIPVPGDYDGDGKFDAAVFRPSNSTWFVQRSTAGTLIQQFGSAGDLPLPSVYIR